MTEAPIARVRLLQTTRLLPRQSVLVPVKVERGTKAGDAALLVEPSEPWQKSTGLGVDAAIIRPDDRGHAHLLVTNSTGCTQRVWRGTRLETGVEATILTQPNGQASEQTKTPEETSPTNLLPAARRVATQEDWRREELARVVQQENPDLQWEEGYSLLLDRHDAFALEEGERGETDLVQFQIETGDAPPKKQAARRIPFGVRQEVAR